MLGPGHMTIVDVVTDPRVQYTFELQDSGGEFSASPTSYLVCWNFVVDVDPMKNRFLWLESDLETTQRDNHRCSVFKAEVKSPGRYTVNFGKLTDGSYLMSMFMGRDEGGVVSMVSNRILDSFRVWGVSVHQEAPPTYSLRDSEIRYRSYDWKQLAIRLINERRLAHSCNDAAAAELDVGDRGGGWCLWDSGTFQILPNGDQYKLALAHVAEDTGLAEGLADLFHDSSVLDVGAGQGQYGRYFSAVDPTIRYFGIDGAYNVETFTNGFVQYADLSIPLVFSTGNDDSGVPLPADWVMSLEVGEHLPAEAESTFIDNIHRSNTKGVVISWAIPFQPGKGHINCHTATYIAALFEESGLYDRDVVAESKLRLGATYEYFQLSLQVFRRK